ncbi:MAG: peptide chain release factor N(5)-glutamine methyltransferase [Candidatus Magasanikbacteria bacterium CG_4_9_14_3_um_filter_32_9]|uniref:peptide chain release factor N(5)-glutamine methyltransferase n=1 Tax=Candidatus Magasanikbacteria bacterium CG_4_9_14_3_um_filter_32_9 TaxID=1974644 RepID=A0A2M7Z691_9BACT|nr:MAG: peptide chain release factor N(5)-glutamine methyltransferase [Candidatus Magasanikbacteria bacterium CG_4_9_14_3_um_filter_32_9]
MFYKFKMEVFTTIKKYKNSTNKLDAELLLSFILGKSREFIVSNPKQKISVLQKIKFLCLVKKRKAGWSTAVLTKHKEFFGLDFKVNKNVLIPRPDTEIMVEKVLDIITPKITLIDIGTGSGCIPISIAKNSKPKNVFAVDVSKKALKIAKENANTHNVKINFIHSNLLSHFSKLPNNLIITANLPYLTKKQFKEEKSIQKEPKLALIAEENGLALYRELLEQVKNKKSSSQKINLFFEINPEQKTELSKIIKTIFSNSKFYLYKDLSNQIRITKVSL